MRANEEGQDLRRAGKLLEARERFTSCATPSCPNILREDCITRHDETQRAIPGVRFIVTDSRGARVPNATITVDGVEAARRPDDSIEVDPGQHAFEISLPGHRRAVHRLALMEGDGRREETIALQPTEGAAPTTSSTMNPYRGLAYGAGGVGIILLGVGTFFGFAAKSTYDDAASPSNCPRGPTSCNAAALEGAKRADDQAAVSTAMFIVGGLLVAGVVLYLTAPKDRSVSLAPAIGYAVAGLEARTTF